MIETSGTPIQDPPPWLCLRDALLRPRRFFPGLAPTGSWRRALLFAAALSFVGSAGYALNDWIFPEGSALWVGPWAWYWNLLYWPLVLGLEFLFLAWFHMILRWRDGAAFGYQATFRAYAYGAAPNLLSLVPVAGMWVAALWGVVLSCYAIKTLQRTTWTRVITTFLIANALLGLLAFGLIFAAGYFRHYFDT